MKTILISLLFFAGAAHADDWSAKNTNREALFDTLEVVDWAQTRYTATHPYQFQENNPYFGKHPSVGRVNLSFLGEIGIHYGVSRVLHGWERDAWQLGGIAIEVGCIGGNVAAGVKFNW